MICKIRCLKKQFPVNGRRRVLDDVCVLLLSAGSAGRGPGPATARDAGEEAEGASSAGWRRGAGFHLRRLGHENTQKAREGAGLTANTACRARNFHVARRPSMAPLSSASWSLSSVTVTAPATPTPSYCLHNTCCPLIPSLTLPMQGVSQQSSPVTLPNPLHPAQMAFVGPAHLLKRGHI